MERFNLRLSTITKDRGGTRPLTVGELVSKVSTAIEDRYPELKQAIFDSMGSTFSATLKSEPVPNVELSFMESLPEEHAIKLSYIIRNPVDEVNIR